MDHIRSYNSAFAFASFGAKIVQTPGNGPYCFKIHDQIYYQTSGIHTEASKQPKYCQLYILDTEMALKERQNNKSNSHCIPEVTF